MQNRRLANLTGNTALRRKELQCARGGDTTLQYHLLVSAPATRTVNAVMFGPAVVTWTLPDTIFEDGFQ